MEQQTCEFCKQPLPNRKLRWQQKFCDHQCVAKFQKRSIQTNCSNCQLVLERTPGNIQPSGRSFCSKSCAATYNNMHKARGIRVSKLEQWLQSQLTTLYPETTFIFNDKEAISSELDIYIPKLKLAFELNGIFHFEPIYGEDKLRQIQSNDTNKFQACHQAGISLCIIDTSGQKRFTEASSEKYLKILVQIIKKHTDPE